MSAEGGYPPHTAVPRSGGVSRGEAHNQQCYYIMGGVTPPAARYAAVLLAGVSPPQPRMQQYYSVPLPSAQHCTVHVDMHEFTLVYIYIYILYIYMSSIAIWAPFVTFLVLWHAA